MSKSKRRIPAYRHYKPKNLAVVRIASHDFYLGKYQSAASWEKYHRLIADWLRNGRRTGPALVPDGAGVPSLSIDEILLAYWRFAEGYYVKDGRPTKELASMRDALRPLRKLYGHTPASRFGPKSLKALRQSMIEVQGLSRGVINSRINRIKRVFKWAVSEELIPPSVYEGLRTVAGLRYGRTTAREAEPVRPVPDEHVTAVLAFVAPQVAAMIRLQRLTGMRPGDVVVMRKADIDATGDIWVYEPAEHKNRWRGHRRLIPLGPQAQTVIAPFLDRPADAYLFSPREAEAWRNERRSSQNGENRKTPVYPSEIKAREKAKQARRKRKPKRPKRDRYDVDSYRRAITYGLSRAAKAGVEIPHWHPHQLRHSRATEVRRRYGLEGAQATLGQARADVTEVYTQRNLDLALRIARETG